MEKNRNKNVTKKGEKKDGKTFSEIERDEIAASSNIGSADSFTACKNVYIQLHFFSFYSLF